MNARAAPLAIVLGLAACIAGTPVTQPENRRPQAIITAPGIAPEGSAVPFGGSRDPDGDAVVYRWDFGDGRDTVTNDSLVSHRYRNNGAYVTRLIVTDAHGLADTAAKLITIANVAPEVTLFRFTADTVERGAAVAVEIQYADPGIDDRITAWLWQSNRNGGTGGLLSQPGVVVFHFLLPGEYRLSLSLEDNDGGRTYWEGDHAIVVR